MLLPSARRWLVEKVGIGLAFGLDGFLYVAEETVGQISRGVAAPVLNGFTNPEGIVFAGLGNLDVVEDIANGRLIRQEPNGLTATLASGLSGPEGIE